MKLLIITITLALLTGCASGPSNYALYAETQAKIAQANAIAETAKYNALAEIAKTGDSAARVAAVISMQMNSGNSQQRQPQHVAAPESFADTALKWTSVLLPSFTQLYNVQRTTAVAMRQSDNQAAIAVSTNQAFVGIATAGNTANREIANAGFNTLQSTTNTGFNALQATGTAGFNALQATGLAGLNATQATGIAGLNATQATGLAGLNATQATGLAGLNATQATGLAGLNATQATGLAGFKSLENVSGLIKIPAPNITVGGNYITGSNSETTQLVPPSK